MPRTGHALMFSVCCLAPLLALGESADQELEVANCRISVIRRALLSGERQGILQEMLVTEGDTVEKGQLLASLRSDLARRALEIARQEAANTVGLRLAKKISEQATYEYTKATELNQNVPGGFSEVDIKKLKLGAEKALLQLEQADFQLQIAAQRQQEAEAVLNTYRIMAPFSGVVLQISKQPGEAMNLGETAVEIANFDTMRVEGFVPVSAANSLKPGADVLVEIPNRNARDSRESLQFHGRLTYIAPLVNEVSQVVRVWAEVPNPDHVLKDGLTATMRIVENTPARERAAARNSPPKR